MLDTPQINRTVELDTPLQALRYVAWNAFKKVALQVDLEREAYINRNRFMSMGRSTSPYIIQQQKNEFLLSHNLAKPEELEYPILPPAGPSISQKIDMAKHKDAFIRTFIPDNKERLAELMAFYDESFPGLSSDNLWKCTELLSTRPLPDDIRDMPPQDCYTHGRILSYVWADIHQDDYDSDVSELNPQVTLSWINEISETIAAQMADPVLRP